MQVHEVEGDPRLEVPIDTVDVDRASDVDDLAVAEIRLRDGLVDRLVLRDPLPEVDLRLGLGHVLVVRIAR
jgi:hypothetical protein